MTLNPTPAISNQLKIGPCLRSAGAVFSINLSVPEWEKLVMFAMRGDNSKISDVLFSKTSVWRRKSKILALRQQKLCLTRATQETRVASERERLATLSDPLN
jgi:hypothetical protein